ncbi:hypothetical protein [Nocardioides stalactiti]|uniref:hypothetical protein n=1 Tax=Nocardioides stalactiti TaxID=2755356 RepID=UPI00160250D3|nr:hypothetical protein [Nocardioides stalactiti]
MIATLRAWGVVRTTLLAVVAVVLVETTATDQFSVPPFSFALNGWSLLPPLVAVSFAEPLVDRSPQLTAHATRSPVAIGLGRLTLSTAALTPVAAYVLTAPEGPWVVPWLVAAAAAAATAVALARSWYWVLLLPLSFGWIQHTHGSFPGPDFAAPVALLVPCAVGAAALSVARFGQDVAIRTRLAP